MHLKTVSLVGFKSFADRTRIECEPGVTVVVGPNGAGKSNLVDAIAWVMGTQATSVLRTERMDDVIFAGTALRPALGRAEVSLSLDNGDDPAAVEPAEVAITRRLYRDGTSEYEINGAPCRLLDIQELLADSGVGRHQHVIIGQGRVDSVLNAGPEEHRTVIEEAAGVVKHRARRDRSIRRLEATEMDVARLGDILEEQQRHLKPLKRQAGAAAHYDSVRAEWRALCLWLGGERIRTLRDRLGAIAAGESAARARLETAVSERDGIVASLGALQAAAGETGEALERDTAAAARLETTAERLHSIALVAKERRLHLERTRTGAVERRADLVSEESDLRSRLAATAADETAGVEAAERAEIALRALDDEERSLAESDRLPAEGLAASLRGDLAALEAAESRDSRESADLARRRGAVAAFIDQEVSETQRLAAELAEAGRELAAAEKARDRSRQAADGDRERARFAEQAQHAAETALAAARARLEALEGARGGLADPETREHAAAIEGVLGTISGRLDVPGRLQPAVDAALGRWAEAFVTRDAAGVETAVGLIKSSGKGGVAFVAASGDTSVPARQVALATGTGTALVDLLGRGADPALAAALLGDVLVVDGWVTARAVVAGHPHVRAVTTEGDLISAAGVIAALPEGAESAVVGAARAAVEGAAVEASRAGSRRVTAHRGRDAAERAEREAVLRLEGLDRRVGGLEEAIRLLDRSRAERTAELDRLDARARAIAEAAAQRIERTTDLRRRIAGLEGEHGSQQELWDDISRRRSAVASRRDEARANREAATAALAAAGERRQLLEARHAEVLRLVGTPIETVDSAAAERLERIEPAARRALEAVRRHVDALHGRQRALRAEAGEAGVRLEKARARREELGGLIEETRETASRLAVEAAELRVREESAIEALRRDVDVAEEVALAAIRPEVPEGVDAEAHAASLAARLRRFGPINPLAGAEYRELAERVSFLEEQLGDLEESRSELRKVIKALDAEIARLFTQAFDDIAGKFTENFSILFPGGTGRLTLTPSDDILDTGVEIHAQPMGKKVGRLQLLSGGERSLAALAFLFALFRSRPSPFYVLDEVEAALDDANLRRFLRLIETMRGTSQLVIVTHQPQTMEAANVLYGVTMEPGESSRVLAKRLAPV